MKQMKTFTTLALVLAGLLLGTSSSFSIEILGTGTEALIGGDLTDPENDGDASGENYNATFAASEEVGFGGGEFAFNIFNNTVGGGNNKWCCGGGSPGVFPIWVEATFEAPVVVSHFTLTNGNDSPQRDPQTWQIQGSNDGINFTDIFSHAGSNLWTERNQVIRWDAVGNGGGDDFPLPDAYTTIRLNVDATGATSGALFQLNEFEIFSTIESSDSDEDGLDDNWEQAAIDSDPDDAIDSLDDINPGDDLDGDTLTNLQEFMSPRTNPLDPDTDADGYPDNVETGDGSFDNIATDTGTNPNNPDTDGDTLPDGVETNDGTNNGPEDRGTNPLLADSDEDGADDDFEIAEGFDPNDPLSTPLVAGLTILGAGASPGDFLIGGDLTDPEDDGDAAGLNYNATFSSSEEPGFGGGEFAFNVFNNTVGGGNNKWCCGGGSPGVFPIWVEATFEEPIVVTHFTLTSSNDSTQRDPQTWQVQGSNDGINFTDIFSHAGSNVWTARNQVIRWDAVGNGGGDAFPLPAGYTTIRLNIDETGATTGALFAVNEFEIFGVPGTGAGFRITEIDYDSTADTFRITWTSKPNRSYSLRWSPDFANWDSDVDDSILSQGETTTYPPLDQPALPNPAPSIDALFFRAQQN